MQLRHSDHIHSLVRHILTKIALQLNTLNSAESELFGPVSIALQHAQAMTTALGEPLMIEDHLGVDRYLTPVIFATVQDGLDILRRAAILRQQFTTPEAQSCYFLMTMHRHEYSTLGSEMDGTIVKREVQQTIIDFKDYRIPFAAISKTDITCKLTEHIVHYLAALIPEELTRMKTTKKNTIDNQELLKAQVRTLEQAHREYNKLAAPQTLKSKLTQGRAELDALDARLDSLPANLDARGCLKEIIQVLSNPQKHIQLSTVTERILDFGIKSPQGRPVHFLDCVYGQEKRRTVLLLGLTRTTARQLWPELDEIES